MNLHKRILELKLINFDLIFFHLKNNKFIKFIIKFISFGYGMQIIRKRNISKLSIRLIIYD